MLTFGGDSTEYRLPLRPATRLEVSAGRTGTYAGRGALTGLIAAGLVGFVWGAVIRTECECPMAFGGIASAVLGTSGALVGGVIGSFIPREQWRPVALPVHVAPPAVK